MQMVIDVGDYEALKSLPFNEFQSGGMNGLIELSLWLLRAFITVSNVKTPYYI